MPCYNVGYIVIMSTIIFDDRFSAYGDIAKGTRSQGKIHNRLSENSDFQKSMFLKICS